MCRVVLPIRAGRLMFSIPKSRPTPSNYFVHRRRSIWEEFRKRTMEDREEMTSPLLNCVRQVRLLPVIENVVLFWTVYCLLVLGIVGVGKKPPCPRVHRMLKCLSKFNQINVGLGATYTLTAFCAFRTIAVIRSESGKNLVFIVIRKIQIFLRTQRYYQKSYVGVEIRENIVNRKAGIYGIPGTLKN